MPLAPGQPEGTLVTLGDGSVLEKRATGWRRRPPPPVPDTTPESNVNVIIQSRLQSAAPLSGLLYGTRFIVAATPGPSDPWVGQTGKLAKWIGPGYTAADWNFSTLVEGQLYWAADENVLFGVDGVTPKNVAIPGGATTNAADLTSGTLADARLPTRLGTLCKTITDWSTISESGFYRSAPSVSSNAPDTSDTWYGVVTMDTATEGTAVVYGRSGGDTTDTTTKTRRRDRFGGTWGSWYITELSAAEIVALTAIGAGALTTGMYANGSVTGPKLATMGDLSAAQLQALAVDLAADATAAQSLQIGAGSVLWRGPKAAPIVTETVPTPFAWTNVTGQLGQTFYIPLNHFGPISIHIFGRVISGNGLVLNLNLSANNGATFPVSIPLGNMSPSTPSNRQWASFIGILDPRLFEGPGTFSVRRNNVNGVNYFQMPTSTEVVALLRPAASLEFLFSVENTSAPPATAPAPYHEQIAGFNTSGSQALLAKLVSGPIFGGTTGTIDRIAVAM